MKKKNLIALLLLPVLTGCVSGPRPSSADVPTITVTIEPLRWFAEAIAGDRFQVVTMVPRGSSPESYDPTPRQLVSLGRSVAYLRIGHIGFEQAWMDRLEAVAPGLQVFDTSVGVDLIRGAAVRHGDHFHPGGVEPHIWNSARNSLLIADNVCAALCRLDASGAREFRFRRDSLKQVISATDSAVRALLADTRPAFLIYHPALSYFARDYGLRQISIEADGKEPSPAVLRSLIDTCRQIDVRVIFVQQEFDRRCARLVADELGLSIVPIHPLGYDWGEEMLRVARALAPGSLKGDSRR